jgi:release factor glutamine methyltransferase
MHKNQENTIINILNQGKIILKSSKIKDVRNSSSFDSEEILCFILNYKKELIFLNYDKILDIFHIKFFFKMIKKRSIGKPLAYIISRKYFYNNEFFINKHTLIPREDSEVLINKSLEIFKFFNKFNKSINIADFGAGSGCLGLSFLKEYKNAKCFLIEKNSIACHKIYQNIENLNLKNRALVINSDWNDFMKINNHMKFDLIISNPPYIDLTEKFNLMKSVIYFEPNYALFDKEKYNHNNSTYMQIINKSEKILKFLGYIVFEIDKINPLRYIDKKKFKFIGIFNDFMGLARCLILRKII